MVSHHAPLVNNRALSNAAIDSETPNAVQFKNGRKRKAVATMTRLELLPLLYSLQALLESDNIDKAREVIEKIIKEAESTN